MIDHPDKQTQARDRGSRRQNDLLQKALGERERFLEQRPHLRAYQEEIDRLLDHSGNSQGRLAVLGMLLQGKLLEMQKQLCTLAEVLAQDGRTG